MIWEIIRKEWLDALRDKRSVSTWLLIPILMPLMFTLSFAFMIDKAEGEKKSYKIGVYYSEANAEWLKSIESKDYTLEFMEASFSRKQLDKYDVLLKVPDDFLSGLAKGQQERLELWYNSASDESKKARRLLQAELAKQRSLMAKQRQVALGVADSTFRPWLVERKDVATPNNRTALLIQMLPTIIIFVLFGSVMPVATDLTAGERERLSLEVLLMQPVKRSQLILAKFSVVFGFGWVAGIITLLMMDIAMQFLPLQKLGMTWALEYTSLVVVAVNLIPLAALAALLMMFVALSAKSFKEAQTTLGFAQLIPFLSMIIVSSVTDEVKGSSMLIPLVGQQEMIRAFLSNEEFDKLWFVGGQCITVALVVVMLVLIERKISSPKVLATTQS